MWRCWEGGAPGDSLGAPGPFPHSLLALCLSCIWLFLMLTEEMSKPVENLYKSLFEPKLMTIAEKLSNAQENESFALSFKHLKLRWE